MLLNKSDILKGLEFLNAKARDAYLTVDLAIYGGTALALAATSMPSFKAITLSSVTPCGRSPRGGRHRARD
jgi:hypothetical protein